MEISLARLISSLIKRPDMIAQANGDVEIILALGGVASTRENKSALSGVLKMLGSSSSTTVRSDSVVGWDGGVGFASLPAGR